VLRSSRRREDSDRYRRLASWKRRQTLSTTAQTLRAGGHEVLVIEPNQFRTFPVRRIRRSGSRGFRRALAQQLHDFAPDCIHIATEGTLGAAARSWCLRNRFPFTTSYHTQFPEYVRARAPIPLAISYAHLRRFHSAAARTMVATPTLQKQLENRGFRTSCAGRAASTCGCSSPATRNFCAAAADRVPGPRRGREEHQAFLRSTCRAPSW
jgi:hypothetical protein